MHSPLPTGSIASSVTREGKHHFSKSPPFSFSPCFIYQGWCHAVWNAPWVSCCGCAPSQLLVLPQPFAGGVRKPWCWVSTARQSLIHSWIINTASCTNPKHGPAPVTREKFTSAKASTQSFKGTGLMVNKEAKCRAWHLTFLIFSRIKEGQAELLKTSWRLLQDKKLNPLHLIFWVWFALKYLFYLYSNQTSLLLGWGNRKEVLSVRMLEAFRTLRKAEDTAKVSWQKKRKNISMLYEEY